MSDKLTLRPATPEDEGFVNDLLRQTMHTMVQATWEDPEHQAHYWKINGFDLPSTQIIEWNGQKIGRLAIDLRENHPLYGSCVFIEELHISSEYHNKGIGRLLKGQVIAEAAEMGLPVGGTALRKNLRMQHLNESMGYVRLDSEGMIDPITGEQDAFKYHYLRPLSESRIPLIPGLSLLDQLRERYPGVLNDPNRTHRFDEGGLTRKFHQGGDGKSTNRLCG